LPLNTAEHYVANYWQANQSEHTL